MGTAQKTETATKQGHSWPTINSSPSHVSGELRDKRTILARQILAVEAKLEALACSKDTKECSGYMLPEDRVARTMALQEDIASKSAVLQKNAEAFKDKLARITKYVADLLYNTKIECDKRQTMFWAEYRTGIKGITP